MIECCYQCNDRQVGCHSTCDLYKTEKEKHDKAKQEIRNIKEPINSNRSYIIQAVRRTRRRK